MDICLQQCDNTNIKLPGDMLGFFPKLKFRLRQTPETSKIMDFYILCAPAFLRDSIAHVELYI